MVGDEALGQGLEHLLVFAQVEIHGSPNAVGTSSIARAANLGKRLGAIVTRDDTP